MCVVSPDINAPQAVLLAGFPLEEVKVVRAMLDDIGAEFVNVITVTDAMLKANISLGKALETAQDQRTGRDWKPAAAGDGVPRLMLMSGMSSDELMSVIQEYQELGAEVGPTCSFCAPVVSETQSAESDSEVRCLDSPRARRAVTAVG